MLYEKPKERPHQDVLRWSCAGPALVLRWSCAGHPRRPTNGTPRARRRYAADQPAPGSPGPLPSGGARIRKAVPEPRSYARRTQDAEGAGLRPAPSRRFALALFS